MAYISSEISMHAKKQENMVHNEKKSQSIDNIGCKISTQGS